LPLAWIYPSPAGTFHAVSQFSFATALPGTVSAQDTWKSLSSDVCDPARLWLDSTIDALKATSADDPPLPGSDGALAALLAARRTVTGHTGSCANQVDGSGRPSLDARVYALFPTGSIEAKSLKKLPDEIGSALTSLTVESTLIIGENAPPNAFNIDHELTAIDLPGATTHSPMTLSSLAAPLREASFVSGVFQAGQLTIGPHGFTLGLGAAARFTFAASSLARRLGVTDGVDVRAFIEALAKLATRDENGTVLQGCDALDSLLCAEAGRTRGCVRAACLSGLESLIERLDTSFAALDGQDLDFLLSGWASIVDRNGDGHADALGSSTEVGIWSGVFKSLAGTTNIYGSWTAERQAAPVP
jgi:hypothetical protein